MCGSSRLGWSGADRAHRRPPPRRIADARTTSRVAVGYDRTRPPRSTPRDRPHRCGSPGDVKFGILGRLDVHDDRGAELPIPAARQRALLAALLLEADRVVPVGRLAEILWDGAGPADAHNTVRSYAQ